MGLILGDVVANAATIVVTTTADGFDAAGTPAAITLASLPGPDGLVTLREAVCAANNNPGADLITFSINGTFILTGVANEDNGGSGDLDIKQSLTIQGNGAANTIIDGNSIERIFDVFPSAASTFDVTGLTLQHGDTRLAAFKEGGAIYLHNNVTALISGCRIINNFSGANGAIENRGTLTITNSDLSGNQTIPVSGSVGGGGLHNAGPLTIVNSTITNNGVRGEGGGIATTTAAGTVVTIVNTLIAGNTASATGGGLGNGGGVSTTGNQGAINIIDCTISDNHADNNGGGAYFVTPGGGTGNANLSSVTVANNTADFDNNGTGAGGGVAQNTAAVTLRNTIVASNFNSVVSVRDDISGAMVASSSFNLIGDGTGSSGLANGVNNNQIGSGASPIDAKLGSSQNNGGLSRTCALLTGSPAVNAGSNGLLPTDSFDLDADGNTSEVLPVDQRGAGFARIIGASVDIGAYEQPLVNAAPVVGALNNYTVNAGVTISFVATASDTNGDAITFSLASPPAFASISGGGAFSWRPHTSQAGTTNMVRIVATDNGTPNLSGTNSFIVVVNALAPVQFSNPVVSNAIFSANVSGFSGPDYIVLASTNLTTWIPLITNLSPTVPFQYTDPGKTSNSFRAYRIWLQP
jgi:hypothetical protein